MGDELLQSDPSSSSDFRFDGCPVTSEEGHKKSDEEDGSLWRSSSPMTDDVRLVLNQPWFWLKEIYFQHFINEPDESVQ